MVDTLKKIVGEDSVLSDGYRTSDLELEGKLLSTKEMGNEILTKLEL